MTNPCVASPFEDPTLAAEWLERWLRTSALPLWSTNGWDTQRGGFHDTLSPLGHSIDGAKRALVQARQTYVFARANYLGWQGPWLGAARAGMHYLQRVHRHTDGLYGRFDAEDPSEPARTYDQAFVLLAMAALYQADANVDDMEAHATELMTALQPRHLPGGGFREVGRSPMQSNCNMHLLEAALAWRDATGTELWADLVEELAALAVEFFVHDDHIPEFFDECWGPIDGAIEPGHQFEWACLLDRSSLGTAAALASRLHAAGLAHFDPTYQIIVDAAGDGSARQQPTARLWPQTEFLKSALRFGDDSQVLAAVNAMRQFFRGETGLWRDHVSLAGPAVDAPCRASSLYHIVNAIESARRTRDSRA